MDLRAFVGYVLSGLGIICALSGLIVLEGVSVEFPGIILGALGYYFALTAGDRTGQIIGIAAVALNVISMLVSGLSGPPQ